MEMETEIQNPIAVEPSLQALALQNQVFEASIHLVRDPDPIVESTARVESRNQINYDSNDDLMIVTPTTVEIKCEQQELTFDNSIENCNPNIMIDLLNDDNTIIIKTEVNDENVAPNRANAIERPIRHNVMTKKPPKPIVERCVGRICAPKKRPRLTSGTMADGIAGGAAAAVSEINESENETISDSENDSISQVGGQSADTEPGIVDATDFNLVAIAFHGSISDLEGPHYDQQAVRVPNIPYCPQCKSLHASKRALQSHYTTKKHKSRTIHLARDAARKLNTYNNFK